jgi:TRAP-type C4-dicarboxylate transport system substrate-binding protein
VGFIALALLLVLALMSLLAACGGTEATTTTAGVTETTASGGEETTTTAETSGEKIVFKYAHFTPGNDFPGRQLDFWADEINKRTNGQVEVAKFVGGTLLTAMNMYDGVLDGVADIGLSFVTYEPGRFPLLSLNDLNGLGYINAAQASQAFFDVVWANQDIAELAEFQVITAFSTEPAHIQTVQKKETVASLAGSEIRTAGGAKYLEALGATGVGMPQSEIGQALQTGVIDGILTSREVLMDFKYAEKIKYVLNAPVGQVSALVVMRKDKYDALPDNVKRVIQELAPEAAKLAGEELDKSVQESLEWSKTNEGLVEVDLSADEAAKFEAALQPVTDAWIAGVAAKGLPAEDFVRQLQEAAKKYQ